LNAAPRVEIANGILFSEALAAEGAVVFAKPANSPSLLVLKNLPSNLRVLSGAP
jgi:hypothetical protein